MKPITVLIYSISFLVVAINPVTEQTLLSNTDHKIYLPIVIKEPVSLTNVVVNADFEAGRTGWIEYGDSPYFDYPLIMHVSEVPLPFTPHKGSWLAWLGGESGFMTFIEQEIIIPEVMPELVYWHWIDSMFECDESVGGVIIVETFVDFYQLCAITDTGGWVKRTVNLNAFAGQTVRLRIFSSTDVDNYSNLFIDSVSIHAAP
jgi:hypothetical protein